MKMRIVFLVAAAWLSGQAGTYIQVVCEPGVAILLNGQVKGVSNPADGGLILEDVAPGSHVLEIQREGLVPQKTTLSVAEGDVKIYRLLPSGSAVQVFQEQRAAIDFIGQQVGTLMIQSLPVECELSVFGAVFINRDELQKTQDKWIAHGISAGAHTVSASAMGKTLTHEVTMIPQGTVHLFFNFLTGIVEERGKAKSEMPVCEETKETPEIPEYPDLIVLPVLPETLETVDTPEPAVTPEPSVTPKPSDEPEPSVAPETSVRSEAPVLPDASEPSDAPALADTSEFPNTPELPPPPSLSVVVNQRGAKVSLDGKPLNKTAVVEPGQSIVLTVSKAGYTTYVETISADWVGLKEVRVSLEEEPGPKEGRKWVADLGDGVTMEFMSIETGWFMMGSASGAPKERPVRRVTISRPFWLAKTEVTQAQYVQMMRRNPSSFKRTSNPVERVSWYDAMSFCRKLTEHERQAGRLPDGWEYTLPTEAQWEYACRADAGSLVFDKTSQRDVESFFLTLKEVESLTGEFPDDPERTGSDLMMFFNLLTNTEAQREEAARAEAATDYAGPLDAMGWFDENSRGKPQPAGVKQPNEWGLFDMHGNVSEWCLDDWYPSYRGAPADGSRQGDGTGMGRVFRGGSWNYQASFCRSAARGFDAPESTYYSLGFRPLLHLK